MKRILLSGIAVMDFIFRLDEFPRQAEKYRARDSAITGGGCAAGAAVAISRLGGAASLACRLGDDRVGDMIVADLEADGVDCTLAARVAGCRSSYSSVYVDGRGERQIVNFRDTSLPADAQWLEPRLPQRFDAALADTRWPAGAGVAMTRARELGVPGIIDAEAPFEGVEEALERASHIAFSAVGLRAFTGLDERAAALAAAGRNGAFVCVTDGALGAFYLDGEGNLVRVPAFEVDAVDTLGAGDVWHGAFALRLAEGAHEATAIRFANAAAALKCRQFGGRAGAPDRPQTEQFLTEKLACN
jgi:sulfofructose kinase